MKPNQKIRILIALMSLALAGVLVIQFWYIKYAIQLKQEQFDRTVNHALMSVSADLENKYGVHLVTEKLEEDSVMRKEILKQDPGFYKFMVSVNNNKSVDNGDAREDNLPEEDSRIRQRHRLLAMADNGYGTDDEMLPSDEEMNIEVTSRNGRIVRLVNIGSGHRQELIIQSGVYQNPVVACAPPTARATANAVPPAPPAPPIPPGPAWRATNAASCTDTQSCRLMNIVKSAADEYAMSKMSASDICDVIDSPKIAEALKKEFAKHGLPSKYVFATYCVTGDSLMINKSASKHPLNDFTYHSPLLATDFIKAGSLLLVDFPGRFNYMFTSIGGMLLLSLFFTLSIVAAFGYSLHVIMQQKKLSEVTNDFINNMTHELKTPLATISMTADTLGLKTVSRNPGMVDEYSGMIKKEVRKLSGHVDRILGAALIERNGQPKANEPVDVGALITEEVKVFQPMAEHNDGTIEVVLPEPPLIINATRDMIRGVICNLLDNAVKYSKQSPAIKIILQRVANNLLLCVEDNGIGISRADQKMIFEKFYRAHTGNRHDVKGFGLGLSYVQNVVAGLHGKVWVESEPGKGSRFFVEFPIV